MNMFYKNEIKIMQLVYSIIFKSYICINNIYICVCVCVCVYMCLWGWVGVRVCFLINIQHAPLHSNTTCFRVKYSQYGYMYLQLMFIFF